MGAIKKDLLFEKLAESGYLYSANAPFVEELYEQYVKDHNSVSDQWRQFFQSFSKLPSKDLNVNQHAAVQSMLKDTSHYNPDPGLSGGLSKQVAVLQLINAYRFRGHQNANLDPIRRSSPMPLPDLDPAYYQLTNQDLGMEFDTGSLFGIGTARLDQILRALKQIYCGNIGWEYMHITNTHEKRWLQERIETTQSLPHYSAHHRTRIFERLVAAQGLERYLHVKYVGQKRFSLEGAESLIPLLDTLIQRAGAHGVKEIVIGMAHRGRLNVLVNILGKSPSELFQEFEGNIASGTGSGDVRYHMGFSSDVQTEQGPVHVTLAFNPSHLEIIDPVVQGSVRARQRRRRDRTGDQALPLLIHGDAAFAGQGVVMETLQMSQARGYMTGGTVHVIINNQIGFTTSNLLDTRSTYYCTDVAKMVQAPIIHVNGDDPESVMHAIEIAFDFRSQFKKDVFVDMVCYRRYGHNEADEPSVTQPLMYQKIAQISPVSEQYAERLRQDRVIDEHVDTQVRENYRAALEQGQTVAVDILSGVENTLAIDWSPFRGTPWHYPVKTGINKQRVRQLCEKATYIPAHFQVHHAVKKVLDSRRQMGDGGLAFDWGFAETIAYASLLEEGYCVRISGQDSGRGTFFHRHAVLHDQQDGSTYIPLQHLSKKSADFGIIDSLLSEEAVLGFEYGYGASDPNTLVIWEAQFGDFANDAQVVIDQFISSGESKWGRLCGLTLFLPHGYDGQGPEHSSARIERYLNLCAEENIQVVVPTVPSQMFHLIRRQMLRPMRKPLVVMTPKSLLRHKSSVSALEDMVDGQFYNIIGETENLEAEKVKRIVVCSGKIYFELIHERTVQNIKDIAIVRIEQLYPFPFEEFREKIKPFANAKELVWCQEEPRNQGPWRYIKKRLLDCMSAEQSIDYAARQPSASPAVGYLHVHLKQQKEVVRSALTMDKEY